MRAKRKHRSKRPKGHFKVVHRYFRKHYKHVGLVVVFAIGLMIAIARIGRTSAAALNEESGRGSLTFSQDPLSQDPWNFFHPTWKREASWKTLFAGASPALSLPTNSVNLAYLIKDPQNRIEREFQISPAMYDRVLFWTEIYAKYGKRIKVVHDRDNLSIIYGYIDARPIYRVLGNSPLADSKTNDIERRVLIQLKAKLAEAGGLSGTNQMVLSEKDEIRSFLSRIGALGSKETTDLIESVRSQTGQAEHFLEAVYRSTQLLPHIEAVFRRKQLPVALARIPFVESSFNVKARSKAGAVGIWQFTQETAREMIRGTEESDWSDPIKQTTSAARLLQMYKSVLPDWGSTLTSYNSGVGRVRRLLQKFRARNIEELLRIPLESDLGFAGRNFYAEFLAANIVEAYKEEIFSKLLGGPTDAALVFKGVIPFPKNSCDL